MGLIRYITDIFGESINQKFINHLENSKENKVPYRMGFIERGDNNYLKLTLPSGRVRIYSPSGDDCISDYFTN